MTGKVYLVGAGPGDPGLLTVKAASLLQAADAVLHDDLVSPEVLKLVSPRAHLSNVGKRCGMQKITQQEINFLMVSLATLGMKVVRLKSGDPLVFGRLGQEIAALRKAGIEFEIVPGITSALGAAASLQIPLTDRCISPAVVLLTGQRADENDPIDWRKFVSSGTTLVIYMPGHRYAEMADRLRAAGASAETLCAIISRATAPDQRTHITSLEQLNRAPQLPSPTLLVVGEVVRFSRDFGSRLPAIHSLFAAAPIRSPEESVA